MNKKLVSLFGLGVFLAYGSTSSAQVLTGTSLPPPSAVGDVVVNFDGLTPNSSFGSVVLNGITFSGVGGNLVADNFPGLYNCQGPVCLGNNGGSTASFRFDFASPVNKFLFNYGATNQNWTLTAYNAGGQVLGTTQVSSINASNAGEYVGIQSNQGISYAIFTHSGGDWILIDNFTATGGSVISSVDTLLSMQGNASVMRKIFSLQASYVNPGLSYDCSIFNKHGVCVAFSGRYSDTTGGGPEATSGVLTAAFKLNSKINIGAFVEQYASNINYSGISMSSTNPDFGVFGLWSQTETGEGLKVRAAYRYGSRSITINREAIGLSEAGSGNSDLTTQGAQLTISNGYRLNGNLLVSPYAGVRYTNIQRNGYTEMASASVTTPLTYDDLHQESTSLLLGVNLAAQVASSVTVMGSIGVETDTSQKISAYSASGVANLSSIQFNEDTRRTRAVATGGVAYKIDNTQQVSAQVFYREEAFGSISTTTGMITYTAGF